MTLQVSVVNIWGHKGSRVEVIVVLGWETRPSVACRGYSSRTIVTQSSRMLEICEMGMRRQENDKVSRLSGETIPPTHPAYICTLGECSGSAYKYDDISTR